MRLTPLSPPGLSPLRLSQADALPYPSGPEGQQGGHEFEIKNINLTESKEHVDAKNFDLMKVLGQGSFGKVRRPPLVPPSAM